MAEYIEREKAIDAMTERNLVVHMDSVNDGLVASCHRSAQRIIANLPAADVRPVVFCKDCEQYGGRPWENNESGICARTDCGVGEFDFCSYGEKKEEADG